MSFLAPLYLAGIAAIGLPILFHMIRRTPKGRIPFSTLMFLEASPPKVTSRSRVEHWLLLLIRAAALILLATAFSRPFLRQSDDMIVEADSQRLAILIDVSASMKRTGLWKQTTSQVTELLNGASHRDSIGLFVFDRELLPLLSFEEWDSLQPGHQLATAKERLSEIKPGWMGTDLGTVVPEAISMAMDESRDETSSRPTEIVVITDLQRGSRIEGLQTFDWPESVTLSFHAVEPETSGNASVQMASNRGTKSGIRARIENVVDSPHQHFTVSVHRTTMKETTSGEGSSDRVQQIHVPPEQSRVVQFDDEPSRSEAFVVSLSGDDDAFDNRAWYVRPQTARVPVIYHGVGASDDPNELRYYLERAFLPTAARSIDFYADSDDTPNEAWMTGLSIIARVLEPEQVLQSSKAVEDGWTLIAVGDSIETCRQAFQIAGASPPDISEASVEGYAMLSDVDLQHPVFQPFNDIRLADFTKLPVWKHRTIDGELPETARVLASLDGRSPAIVELPHGHGRVLLFTFGWHDEDSPFVLSSKFVPLMNSLVDDFAGTSIEPQRAIVGERFPVEAVTGSASGKITVRSPSSLERDFELSSEPTTAFSEPGIHEFSWTDRDGRKEASIAVNLDPLESRTDALGMDEIRALGVPLPDAAEARMTTDEKRQLLARELESRQRFWQWVILTGIVLLLIETWLAGRLAQSTQSSAETT